MVSLRQAQISAPGRGDDGSGRVAPLGHLLADLPPPEADTVIRAALAAGELAPGSGTAVAAAEILAALHLDHEAVAATLLYSATRGAAAPADLLEGHGPAVARLVDGARRLDRIGELSRPEAEGRDRVQVERLRRLLLAIVDDVRVVLVRLAERLQGLRELRRHPPEVRRVRAREALEVDAPLAARLGIRQFKWELEDLAFRALEPAVYADIARRLDERRGDRERYVSEVVAELDRRLAAAGVAADVSGRPKHIYSIWRKMQGKGVAFEELYDLRAVRVLVEDVAACYAALGVVHSAWPHIPREFDDYIANPKLNGYRSLHTAVVGPGGKPLEVQIRSREMHAHAEFGVAAHWRYKEDGDGGDPEARAGWLRQLLESRDGAEAADFIDRLNAEAVDDRIYAVTPQGRILELAGGATPLDFAYQVHTDVGHRCRGAKVNGRIVPLTYALRTGDQVEILTTRQPGPSRDWINPHLGYLRTARARSKVRQWFRQQDHAKHLAAGQELFQRELKRLGVPETRAEDLPRRFNYARLEDFLAGLGAGDVTTGQLAGVLQPALAERAPPLVARSRPAPRDDSGSGIQVSGVGNLMVTLARCCAPVPPDGIVGYITRGRGVTVHRGDCPNVLRLGEGDRPRLVDVAWTDTESRRYPVDLQITAYDRMGLLRDVTAQLANEALNVRSMDLSVDESEGVARIRLAVDVRDLEQLSRILDRIGQLPNVLEARRVG